MLHVCYTIMTLRYQREAVLSRSILSHGDFIDFQSMFQSPLLEGALSWLAIGRSVSPVISLSFPVLVNYDHRGARTVVHASMPTSKKQLILTTCE